MQDSKIPDKFSYKELEKLYKKKKADRKQKIIKQMLACFPEMASFFIS